MTDPVPDIKEMWDFIGFDKLTDLFMLQRVFFSGGRDDMVQDDDREASVTKADVCPELSVTL